MAVELQVRFAVALWRVNVHVFHVVNVTTKLAGVDLIAVEVDVQRIFVVAATVKLELAIFNVAFKDQVNVIVVLATENFELVVVGCEDVGIAVQTAGGEGVTCQVNQGDLRVQARVNHDIAFDLVRAVSVDLAHVFVVHAVEGQAIVIVTCIQTKPGDLFGHQQTFSEVVGELTGEDQRRLSITNNRVNPGEIRKVDGQVVVVGLDDVDIRHRNVQTQVCVGVHELDDVVACALDVLDVTGHRAVQHTAVELEINVRHQREGFKARHVFEAIHPSRVEVVSATSFGEVQRIVACQTVHDVRRRKVRVIDNFEFVVVVVCRITVGDVQTSQGIETSVCRVKISVH